MSLDNDITVAKPTDVTVEETTIDPASLGGRTIRHLSDREAVFARWGLTIGTSLAITGIILITLGVTGAVEIELTASGVTARIQTAVVGVTVIFAGVLVILSTRYRFSMLDRG